MRSDELLALSRSVSRQLRKKKLELDTASTPLCPDPAVPDIFFVQSPEGDYPVVSLRSVPCDKYLQGFCMPCSYSSGRSPLVRSGQGYQVVLDQIEWLLARFDIFFRQRTTGLLTGYRLRSGHRRNAYMMELAGESSFFSDREIPPFLRKTILKRLDAFQRRRKITFHIVLETRPEHFLLAENQGELAELSDLFRKLNVAVNFGFEYQDHFLRNCLYGKDLEMDNFVDAVRIAHSYHLDPGGFLFCGGCILTVGEMLQELESGLALFRELDLFANVMIENIQSWTIPDVLWEYDMFTLPEPYLILDILDLLRSYRPTREYRITPYDWFLGGLVSSPVPRATLLDNPRRKTPYQVAEAIGYLLAEIVAGRQGVRYTQRVKELRAQAAYGDHLTQLQVKDKRPYADRWEEMLLFAKSRLSGYKERIETLQ